MNIVSATTFSLFTLVIVCSLNVLAADDLSSVCTYNANVTTQRGQSYYPIHCQVSPNRKFTLEYEVEGYGESIYVLTESQYMSYLTKIETVSPSYEPKSSECLYRIILENDANRKTSGLFRSQNAREMGVVRVLVKQNSDNFANSGLLNVKMNMQPLSDNLPIIIGASIGGAVLIGLVFLIVLIVVVVIIVRRRKKSYTEVI